jgi:hypothetical protein
MRVTLMPTGTSLHLPGILTVICVIGPNPPNSINGPQRRGTLDVPGVINFNHSAGGENIYIQTSQPPESQPEPRSHIPRGR